jgi:hypothetical protein
VIFITQALSQDHFVERTSMIVEPCTTWTDHRDRLARHGRLWVQDGLTFFCTSTVDWL